jgi:hypothetical protein
MLSEVLVCGHLVTLLWTCGSKYIMAGAGGRGSCSPHGSQEAERERERERESQCTLPQYFPDDLTSFY